MSSFHIRTSINGENLSLAGNTQGSLSISSRYKNGDMTVTLSSNNDLTLVGNGNMDATIIGRAENDDWNFAAATGNNTYRTNGGHDTIVDGSGNSTLVGGNGDDIMTGNDGADRFVFGAGSNRIDTDTITDFDPTENDVLVFRDGVTPVDANFDGFDTTITLSTGDFIVLQGIDYNPIV